MAAQSGNLASTTEASNVGSVQVSPALAAPKIWAVGGGKGGVGKSFISSSLGISLAQQGFTVVIIDLDLGGANIHTCLGLDISPKTLSDYFANRVQRLEELYIDSKIRNLHIISGANDALNVADVDGHAKERLMNDIRNLKAHYVILDLGAGTSENTLDFFLMAEKPIVTILPEPTSIENAYRFIKAAFYRHLRNIESGSGIKNVIEEAMDHKNRKGIRSPADLIRYVIQVNPQAGLLFQSEMQKFRLQIIINQARTGSDIEIGKSIQGVCKRYFGIETDYLGYLDYDTSVWQSLRKKRPLFVEFPGSRVVGQLSKISKVLIDPVKYKSML